MGTVEQQEPSGNSRTLGHEMEDGNVPLPSKVRQKVTSLWGEAEADLSEGHIHSHVRQQSTEERKVPLETQGGLEPPAALVPWLGWPPPPGGQDNVPAALSKH